MWLLLAIRFSRLHLCCKLESTVENLEVMFILDAGNKLGECRDREMFFTSECRYYFRA